MKIISNPVQVIKASDEQKKLFEAPFEVTHDPKVNFEKPKLTLDQEKSIPDLIDNIKLNNIDKYFLLFDAFVPEKGNISYFIDDKGYINRQFSGEQTENAKKFVNFEDVNFNMKKTELNQENFDYLKKSLKYLGFGENLNSALEVKLKSGSDKFTLGATAAFDTPKEKDTLNYELRFTKSSTSDKYFLNNYQATLEKAGINEKQEETISRVFTLNKGNDITAKEAYNLLSGRSIQKRAEVSDKINLSPTGEPTKRKEEVWMKLDFEKKNDHGEFAFKTFYKGYGFDLKNALEKLPIKELNDPEKLLRLVSSLNRGNLQSVTIDKNGSEEKAFIAANPEYKNLSVYDKDLKPIFDRQQENRSQTRGR
uniref:hypothetical protein n=1 Tax=Pedobacter sp. TaxID=1411316 RepID=UPI00159AECD3|nr:hypothetical protein [Pedobacter sp.]QJS06258.1 hypothetical protein [Pedobacter sp.]